MIKKSNRMAAGLTVAVLSLFFLALGAQAVSAAGKTKVTWYGQSAFKIVTPNGGVILIDPWLTVPTNPRKDTDLAKLDKADYILITHAHNDHVGNSVAIAKKTGAHLVSSYGLAHNLVAMRGYPAKQATAVTSGNVGGTFDLKKVGAKVTIVNAIHGSDLSVKDPAAGAPSDITSGNPIGFVVQIDGGPTFYHTGDTDVFTDMKLIDEFYDVDVMLTTIGGHFTMDPIRAALAVQFVQPKMVMPMHYGTFGLLKGRPAGLQAAMKKRGLSAKMVAMKPGDTREF